MVKENKQKKVKSKKINKSELHSDPLNIINTVKLLHLLEVQMSSNQSRPWLKEELYQPYLSYLLERREKEGLAKMIEINKLVRLSVTRYIAGKPFFAPFLKSTKDGLPSCLGPLRDLVRSNDMAKLRYTLSILAVTKPLKLPIKPNKGVITTPTTSVGLSWKSFLQDYVKKQGWKINLRSDSSDLSFLTTKSGPNGQALATSLLDLSLMPERLADTLYRLAPNYIESILPLYTGAKQIATDLGVKSKSILRLRRLSPIQDKEGKTRIIAIGDYFSQAVLRPIHTQLIGILSRIPQDMTLNQHGHGLSFGSPEQHYHSLDLSNATDRFPVEPQRELLEVLSGDPEGSYLWRDLMIGYPFTLENKEITKDNSIAFTDEEIMYKAGQPMGLYSSWATFALTHHLIVQYSAFLVGYDQFNDYILLGDDIVLRDDKVADSYRSVMSTLGVEISEPKTLVSKDTFEFAKKTLHRGQDISPIPAWSLNLSTTSTELAGSLSEIYKSYRVDPSPESISQILRLVCGNDSKRIKALGSAHKIVPLLIYFPMPEKQGEPVAYADKTQRFFSALAPGIPCWNVTILETLTGYLVADHMASVVRPGLRGMVARYEEMLTSFRTYFSSKECSDYDPTHLRAIPLYAVLKQQNEKVNQAIDNLIQLGAGILEGPLVFDDLIISDPTKLVQDRQHLKITKVKSQMVLEIRKEFRRISSEEELTPSKIQGLYAEFLMQNAIIAS